MQSLLAKKCVPCEAGVPPLTEAEAKLYLGQVKHWILEHNLIKRDFKFKDFKEAMDFINKVADLAEQEGHHPDIYIFYNKVSLQLSTHAINGLSDNDFILAAKINNLLN